MERQENILKIKEELKDAFKLAMGIVLIDSPQILEDYLYLEFEDRSGKEIKLRISYPNSLDAFLRMKKKDRLLFISVCVIRSLVGETK